MLSRALRNKKEEKTIETHFQELPFIIPELLHVKTLKLHCCTSLCKLKAIQKRNMTDFLPKFKIREESVTFTTYFWKSSIDFHYWFLSNSTVFIQYLIRSSVMHFKMQLKYKIHSRMRYTMGRYIHPPQYHNCHLLTSLCYQTKQIMSATLDST